MATAARNGTLIMAPPSRVEPRTTDSGMPSSSAPSDIARPLLVVDRLHALRRDEPR